MYNTQMACSENLNYFIENNDKIIYVKIIRNISSIFQNSIQMYLNTIYKKLICFNYTNIY